MKDKKDSGSQYTTVKTIYARAAVLLLAVNFCLTGYVLVNLNKAQQEQIDGIQSVSGTTAKEARTLSQEEGSRPASPATETRENQ